MVKQQGEFVKNNACADCVFYLSDAQNIGKQGQCRRFPPYPYPMPTRGMAPNTVNVNVISVSPLVQADYWCGEFKPRAGKAE